MKKNLLIILIVFCTIFINFRATAFADSERYVRVVYSTINVFETANATGGANVIGTAQYGQKLLLNQNTVVVGDDDLNYYSIVFNDVTGYVLCSQVTLDELSSPKKELDTNAEISKDANIYNKENEDYIETQVQLKNGTKIKILDGLDYSKSFTRIQYQEDNNDIKVGYVKTINIKKSGISRATIGAICIIVATVSIVLVSFGIKARLKKKIRQK